MAKDDTKEADKVDEETLDFLEKTKKGKPHRFVMLCKGASVVSLVLYKKGNVEKYKKQAKEQGTGQIFFGVVRGRGMDLNFQLAKVDGFDKPPVKTQVLKDFLQDGAEFKCKPLIEIVEAHGAVLDDDDPLAKKFLQLQPAALLACDAHPAEAAAINELCLTIGRSLETDATEQSQAKLTELEALLTKLKPVDPERQAFLAAREKLAPTLAKFQKEHPDKAAALQKVWDFAESQFQAANIAGANKALAGLASSLTDGTTAGGTTTGNDTQKQAFADRRNALEQDLLDAQKADREKASKLLQVWDYAQGKADAGDYATALKALEGLEATLKKVLAEAPKTDTERFGIQEGIVAERRKELAEFFQQRVEKAKQKTDADVGKLTTALDEHIENSKQLTAAINKELHRLYDDFAARINKALDSGSREEVEAEIARCRKDAAANKLIDRLGDTGSELGMEVGVVNEIADLFIDAVDKMETVLA